MEKKQSSNFCEGKFSWVGYPDDIGVKNVKGRPGAKEGPEKIWEYFQKLNGLSPVFSALSTQVQVVMADDLAQNHEQAASQTLSQIQTLELGRDALIAVGGGHDYAYPWIKSFREKVGPSVKIGCINLDAHFDLRSPLPVMTSGAPFRRLIEENILDGECLVEFGIQSHCNAPELKNYAESKHVTIIPFERCRNGSAVHEFENALRKLGSFCDLILISLDLDALSFAFAPGVSAPQGEGFTSSEVYQMVELAGADPKVGSLGIFELCPPLDTHDLTSRLAAQIAWHFLNAKLFPKGQE